MVKRPLIHARILAIFAILISCIANPLYSTEQLTEQIDIGLQYRIMYNNSDLRSTHQYDFFRQRLRLWTDFHPEKNVGGYIQLEYRGGWGGSAPAYSDPRAGYAINPYNRLQARGIRYGYLYFSSPVGKVMAGIIPLDDQTDQMLFSAYYDLNVGGILLSNKLNQGDYRLAYVRLADGVAFRNDNQVRDKDEHFVVADFNLKTGAITFGLHYYGIYGDIIKNRIVTLNHSWLGVHLDYKRNSSLLHGLLLYNSGMAKLEAEPKTTSHGWLLRTDLKTSINKARLDLMALYSSGKPDGTGFQTFHALIGTSGYWAYTHLFTYDGPSGVNDYAFEPGNLGYGLTTVQAQISIPLIHTLVLNSAAAWLKSSERMPISMTQSDDQIGTELTAFLTCKLNGKMTLDLGSGVIFLGEAGKTFYQQTDTDVVNEIFGRLQFVY